MGRVTGRLAAMYLSGVASLAIGSGTVLAQEQRVMVQDEPGTVACERSATAAPLNANGYALIIGNKNYRTGVPRVEYAHNDTSAICKLVVDQLGYRPGNVFVVRDASKETLDDWLGGADFDGYLAKRLGPLAAEAEILVYYSGHGVPGNDGAFLLPVTAGPLEVGRKGYPLQLLTKKLVALGGKRMLLILEACFSGRTPASAQGLVPGTSYAVRGKSVSAESSLAILAAAGPDQVANWDDGARLGLMTASLVRAAAGPADRDKDGKASLVELQQALARELPDRSFAMGKDRIQVPSLSGPNEQWSFLVPPRATVAPERPVEKAVGTFERHQAGQTFKDCAECPEMVVLPAGSFVMGSPPNEEGREDSEGPQHLVKISRPFAVGKFEVTFDEWDACVTQGGCRGYRPPDEGWGRGRRPVIHLSLEDARAYLAWVSRKTGQTYRLLSEAEWEYSARGITDGSAGPRYSWGNDADVGCHYANGLDRSGADGSSLLWPISWIGMMKCRDGYVFTAPVGNFAANSFGLHDMHGNVWEWVEDPYHGSYLGAPTDGGAWTTGTESWRVLRGGSWNDYPWVLRTASRGRNSPDSRLDITGFRVARMLTS